MHRAMPWPAVLWPCSTVTPGIGVSDLHQLLHLNPVSNSRSAGFAAPDLFACPFLDLGPAPQVADRLDAVAYKVAAAIDARPAAPKPADAGGPVAELWDVTRELLLSGALRSDAK